jgi:DNA-binding CsgD family transcriptional regulator
MEDCLQFLILKLEKIDAALQDLKDTRSRSEREERQAVSEEMRRSVWPYINNLTATALDEDQKKLLGLIEQELREMAAPCRARGFSPETGLSPKEASVARLIRDGKSSKDIAALLNLSMSTILTHRHHIRAKLGLKHQKKNLRSFLEWL